jgi:dTDP-4-dehydrorhamnose 3,5-epimerase-like enzyme
MKNVIVRNVESHKNNSGILNYCNSFIPNRYKRIYTISHPKTSVIRAWQGHPNEGKCFIPVRGKFLICWVKINDFVNPSQILKAKSLILDSNHKKIIEIPKGYANGLKALEPDSEVMVFSEFSLEDSSKDIIRYDYDQWFNWKLYD